MNSSAITGFGIMIALTYGIVKILEFYNIGIDKYGSYIAFYVFLFTSAIILPTKYKHT